MAGEEKNQPLGDLVELVRGTTYRSALLGKPGPVLLGLATIERNGGFRSDSLKTYGGDSPDRLILRPGDIYVSLKDVTQSADLLGAAARVPADVPAGRLTQDTVKLELKRGANADLVYWSLRTPEYREYCRSHATGTTNLGLARTDFLAFRIPPLSAERRVILNLLSALDTKIEANSQMVATLDEMARALFKSWLVDFDPVHANAQGRDTGLPADIAALFPTSFDDKGLPDGWRSGSLDDLAETNSESWKASSHPEEVEYVDLSNCKWGNIDGTTRYRWEDAPSRARRVARAGDTIFGTVRPGNGSYAFIGREGLTVSTGFAVLRPKEVIYREMVYFAATSIDNIRWLEQLAAGHGGAYPAVNPDKVSATAVTVPCEKVAEAFADTTADLIDRIELLKQESNDLEQLRDTLLPKLLPGELRVTDAEAVIAAA